VFGSGEETVVRAPVPAQFMRAMAARLDQSMPVGNEGAGVVVQAGADARHLLGRVVAVAGGSMFAQHRTLRAADCLVLPEGATSIQGASAFVNPMTALAMTEVMRREGHKALVHTAAASNLGQMLNRICIADGIGLVNIVRSPEQAAILRDIGAVHVCDSSTESFVTDLTEALVATGATLAFDAIGGGKLAGQILNAMEAAASRSGGAYSRYGSSTHKQVYIYGGLDMRPTELNRAFGMAWGVGGWLLTTFFGVVGRETVQAMKARVMAELTTTFASHYTASVSLAEALHPDVVNAYNRRATGEKYLILPHKDV
jgi:NADPH:quinone reductase-like Zn-dependent oxidoreductase